MAGLSATYTRGAVTVPVTLVRGRQNQRVEGEMGAHVIGNRQDFFLRLAQISTLPTPRPERGDLIAVGATEKWVVQPESGGSECWVFSDPELAVARVHTVRRAA